MWRERVERIGEMLVELLTAVKVRILLFILPTLAEPPFCRHPRLLRPSPPQLPAPPFTATFRTFISRQATLPRCHVMPSLLSKIETGGRRTY